MNRVRNWLVVTFMSSVCAGSVTRSSHVQRRYRTWVATFLIVAALCSPSMAFKSRYHAMTTRSALLSERLMRTVDGQTLTFALAAIAEVSVENKQADCLHLPWRDLYGDEYPWIACFPDNANSFDVAALHFDGEQFLAASRMLMERRRAILDAITRPEPDGMLARRELGKALHAVQDFYAHSNWVELTRDGVVPNAVHPDLGASKIPSPGRGDVFCTFDLDFVISSTPLIRPTHLPLTSGYWFPIDGCVRKPPGKCAHGFEACRGIEKDQPRTSGRDPDFETAVEFAIESSIRFVEMILNDPAVSSNPRAVAALMGMEVGGTLALVIDTSGSMGEEIGQVKQEVHAVVDEALRRGGGPSEYVLVLFNDPEVETAIVSAVAEPILQTIDAIAIEEDAGGDCPERSQEALQKAVSDSRQNSTIFLFTDAYAKDGERADAVVQSAKSKNIRIVPILSTSNDCEADDGVYARVASETGGLVFYLGETETGRIFDLIRPSSERDFVTVVEASGELVGTGGLCSNDCWYPNDGDCDDGGPDADYSGCDYGTDCGDCGPRDQLPGAAELTIPVDSTLRRLVVAVSARDNPEATLVRPTGATIEKQNEGYRLRELNAGRILTVEAPTPGTWRLRLRGIGPYAVHVGGNSELQFSRFEFAKLSGRAAHEALFPISGEPLDGQPATAVARVLGAVSSEGFWLMSATGSTLERLELAKDHPDADPEDWVGSVTLPSEQFGIAVSGVDQNGYVFERRFPAKFRAQPVQVQADPGFSGALRLGLLRLGATNIVKFNVRNIGTVEDDFDVVVTEPHGFVTRVEPSVLSVAGGAARTVEVEVTVPSTALEGACSPGTDCTDCGAGSGVSLCSDECRYAGDGDCDDGGPNADYSYCDFGTDCTDCGSRDATLLCDVCSLSRNGRCDEIAQDHLIVQLTMTARSRNRTDVRNTESLAFAVTNCPACSFDETSPEFTDCDSSGIDDACEICLHAAVVDVDGDGVLDSCDNCPDIANADQRDSNGDGVGDACEDEIGRVPPRGGCGSGVCGAGGVGPLMTIMIGLALMRRRFE